MGMNFGILCSNKNDMISGYFYQGLFDNFDLSSVQLISREISSGFSEEDFLY